MITNPRFTADAERSRDDFASPEEFERKKRNTLSPSIRENIDDLNRNYVQYAQAFPEISELTTVARLMGLCSWLFKATTDMARSAMSFSASNCRHAEQMLREHN